ncbi:MAG: AI-2E family transporter [Holosporales bacterium]|nr:AI-2E family transporter [Holosporales bacterium]
MLNTFILCAVFLLVYSMGQWFVPFAIALVLAYAFHAPTQFLSRKLRISHSFSSGIVILLTISILFFFTLFLFPILKNALFTLIKKLPLLIQSLPDSINSVFNGITTAVGIDKTFEIGNVVKKYLIELTMDWPSYVLNFVNTGVTLVYVVMFVFMIPVITFYLLKDWKKIEESFEVLLRRMTSDFTISLIKSINTKLGTYIKGQLLVCSILFICYTVALAVIGTREYVVCGIFSGVISFIPFFGPFTGLLTTLALSLDDFSFTHQYIATICLYILVPLMDANFLTPRLIGKITGIRPIWLLFSICATASIFGTCGVIMSVPIAVIVATICRELIKKI